MALLPKEDRAAALADKLQAAAQDSDDINWMSVADAVVEAIDEAIASVVPPQPQPESPQGAA